MKSIVKCVVVLAAAASFTSSCKKEFKEMNTDPNTSSAALPEQLLTPAVYSMVNANLSRALRINNELMQDHVTTTNTNEIHRFVLRPGESDFMWNSWYLQLNNFRDMFEKSSRLQQKSFMGIALICDVWTSSLLTDVFGDVPYSEAVQGRDAVFQPKFDRQQDIYADLFKKLDSANTLLAANQTVAVDQISLDELYGARLDLGDAAAASKNFNLAWRKFGNSLFLRLLMRVSAKADVNTIAKIKDILVTNAAKYPVFANNAESAVLKFRTVAPYVNTFRAAGARDFDFNGSIGLTLFFVDNLKAWGDPRIAKWSTKVNGEYLGIPSGYISGQVPERKSTLPLTLRDEQMMGNIMSYPELQFLLAEAAVKGYIPGTGQTYYESGVNNGITAWGYTVPANYFSSEDVRWADELTPDEKLEKIMAQKYYSLFFTDFQQWIEYRRTGHPLLPKGAGLQNGGNMPARFKYPVAVQSLNKANYNAAVAAMGGPDDLNTKVWWNQ